MIDHGYISKRTQEGRDQIRGLLEKCHLLVLPTRAEAYGLVFCEANAYGMPVLATHTGGVPTIVKEGVNGWLYPMEAGGEYYAARVRKIMEDRRTYEEYCMEAHYQFKTRLNWDVAGREIQRLMKDI